MKTSPLKKPESEPSRFRDVKLPASKLAAWRETLLRRWARSPMSFLTAVDPTTERDDGKPSYVWTTMDERAEVSERPFPNWYYLHAVFGLYQREPVTGIEKSRQVFMTTATLAYTFHKCAFNKGKKALLSKANQDEAELLLEEKIRGPFRRMPPWIQDALEISERPAKRIRFRRSGSVIEAVAKNAAVRGLRGGTASLVVIDEAALQENLSAMLRAAAPMAAQIICLTSADGGEAGGEAFVSYFDAEPEKKKRLKPLAIPRDDIAEETEASVFAKPLRDQKAPLALSKDLELM